MLKAHDPPILFNLDTDPGERHPLDPLEFQEVIQKFKDIKEAESAKIKWEPSEMKKGKSRNVELCCNRKPDCTPFPKCCDCPKSEEIQHETVSVDIEVI